MAAPLLQLTAAPRVTAPRFHSNDEKRAINASLRNLLQQPHNPPPMGPSIAWPAAAAAPARANINMNNARNNMNTNGGRRRSCHAKKTRRNKRHAKKTRRNRKH
jgi:hypothetical protein